MEASTVLMARSSMLEVKNNYKNKYRNRKSRMFNNKNEDQVHILKECPALERYTLKTKYCQVI